MVGLAFTRLRIVLLQCTDFVLRIPGASRRPVRRRRAASSREILQWAHGRSHGV